MTTDDYTARAKREAAAIIADVSPSGGAFVPQTYEPFLGIVAGAWIAGYRAALEDQIRGGWPVRGEWRLLAAKRPAPLLWRRNDAS